MFDWLTQWQAQWPQALNIWGRYVQLQAPQWCITEAERDAAQLTTQILRVRLPDHHILVNVPLIEQKHLHRFGLELLAHEIGHHIYCPFNTRCYAHLLIMAQHILPATHLHSVVQGYTDLLVSARLYQLAPTLPWVPLWQQLLAETDSVWQLFYGCLLEAIWHVPHGTLVTSTPTLRRESALGHRILTTYQHEWLQGMRYFALLAEPHLPTDAPLTPPLWQDLEWDPENGIPFGLAQLLPDEATSPRHPSQESHLTDYRTPAVTGTEFCAPTTTSTAQPNARHYREPWAYGELLQKIGIPLAPSQATVRYYLERAWPYVIPRWPRITSPQPEPLPESLEPWELGHALESIDWFESMMRSPKAIPGITLVERQYEQEPMSEPPVPLEYLDLLLDCSGSMPHPHQVFSCYTLAAVILIKSARQCGLSVRATLWSGKSQFYSTGTFIQDEALLLQLVTSYIGGATTFPMHMLRETYLNAPAPPRAQVIIISDEGIAHLAEPDESGQTGYQGLRLLKDKGVHGWLLLRLQGDWRESQLQQQLQMVGWPVYALNQAEELVAMAQKLSLNFKPVG